MSTLIALISMTDHYSGGLLSKDMKGFQATTLVGKMSTLIAQMRTIEHHSDVLL